MKMPDVYTMLPHAYPFVFVDTIESLESHDIATSKKVTINDRFLIHYPDGPSIFPVSLIIENVAQTSGVLLRNNLRSKAQEEESAPRGGFLIDVKKVTIYRQVYLNETMITKSKLTGQFHQFCKFTSTVEVDNEKVMECQLTLYMIS